MRSESKFTLEDFYHPERFATEFDTVARGAEQFNRGLEIGKQAYEIHIGINDVWSARVKNPFGDIPSTVQSYEKIGYHANTADLLRGFICSKCKLIVHRVVESELVSKDIK